MHGHLPFAISSENLFSGWLQISLIIFSFMSLLCFEHELKRNSLILSLYKVTTKSPHSSPLLSVKRFSDVEWSLETFFQKNKLWFISAT